MNVLDVAEYILKNRGSMPAMKLQKLVYYAQAWSLVWDERPLFLSELEAWADGPVSPEVYKTHRGNFTVTTVDGDASSLDADARKTVDAVLDFYGGKSSQWLSDLTHTEQPWLDARGSLSPGARSNKTITKESMKTFYSSLK
ncbi:MAG TPA: type II toxin-antitoxin system antitoxin SocA domain-containing protein [Candidatus Baltobacteraceae bacterium]|nr:type II toxin-antitoxin system antitoxin SocA domain-containing protein [Candidatus Baltobacteraceae bacterium]